MKDNNSENNISKPKVKEETNAEIVLKEKLIKIIEDTAKLNEELQTKSLEENEKVVNRAKQEADNKENKLIKDKEDKYAQVKSIIDQARAAAVAGNYNDAERLLNEASAIIAGNPLLKGSNLESSLLRISSEMIEVQNGYISTQGIKELYAYDMEQERKELFNSTLGGYYKDANHREMVHSARKDIEENREPPVPVLKEYVNHTLEKDEKETQEVIERLALMVDFLDRKEQKIGLTKEEVEEREHYKVELKGAKLDKEVRCEVEKCCKKETGIKKPSKHELQQFANTQFETPTGIERMQKVVHDANRKVKDEENLITKKSTKVDQTITGNQAPSINFKDILKNQNQEKDQTIETNKKSLEQENKNYEPKEIKSFDKFMKEHDSSTSKNLGDLTPPTTPSKAPEGPGKGGPAK